MIEIDFSLFKGKVTTKPFTFTNQDDTIYQFGSSTARCDIWEMGNETPVFQITCTVNNITGVVAVPFTATHTADIGTFEYKIVEIHTDLSEDVLVGGNISVISYIDGTLTINAFLRSEFPADTVLDENFVNQKKIYWQYFLYDAAGLTTADIQNEDYWSINYRMLIAKLIAYDALLLAIKGNTMAFLGASTTETGGSVKRIETGPSNAEFFDPANFIDRLLKPGFNGASALDSLLSDVCGLANKIGVKVPPCKFISKRTYVPFVHRYDDTTYVSLTSTVIITPPSQG